MGRPKLTHRNLPVRMRFSHNAWYYVVDNKWTLLGHTYADALLAYAKVEAAHSERLVREGLISAETIAPALTEARRKAQARRREPVVTDMPWPSEKFWREVVAGMRDVLRGDDIPRARELLREIVGPAKVEPTEDGVIVELAARRLQLRTGTGIWVGSGGGLRIHIPNRRPSPRRR